MSVPKRQIFPLVFFLTANEAIPTFGLKSFVCLIGVQRLQSLQTPFQ